MAASARARAIGDEITIFDSVGLRGRGFFGAALPATRQLAAIGVPTLDLVPDLADPRDLFGLIGGEGRARGPRPAREASLV